jgi:hypothetical protein
MRDGAPHRLGLGERRHQATAPRPLMLLRLSGRPPFRPTGTGPTPLWPAPSTPKVHRGSRRTVRSIVFIRPLAMVATSLQPNGWSPTSGSVRMKFHLRPCIDSKRSNRAGKSLASGARRRSALQQAGYKIRPVLLVCGGAPRRNRTGDPILTMDRRPSAVLSRVLAGRTEP